MEQLIAIQLTEADAKKFVQFQKHYALLGLLESIGAFQIKDGNVKIHFDHSGQIKAIDKFENFRV